MKRYFAIIACIALTGCASSRPPDNTLTEEHQYESATASALAFDAPVAAAYPLPGLDREAREPGAFIGYQDSITESFSIEMQDNQSNDPSMDIYNHTLTSEKVGTRYR